MDNKAHDIFVKRDNLLEVLNKLEKIENPFVKKGGIYKEIFTDGLTTGFNEGLHHARHTVLVMLEEIWKRDQTFLSNLRKELT